MVAGIESFYPARGRNVAAAVLSLAVCGFSVWKAFHGDARAQWIFGGVCAPIAALLFVIHLRYLAFRGPSIVLDREGFSVALPSLLARP